MHAYTTLVCIHVPVLRAMCINRSMGSKTELPHMNMPLKDSLEDLDNTLVQQNVASGYSDATSCDESEDFMSQLSLRLDSLRKDEMFDLAQESPLQELGSLPPHGNNETEYSDSVTPNPLSDNEHGTDGIHLLEDSSIGHEMPSFSDVHLLEENTDIRDEQEVHSKVTELVVQTATFDTILENTTPMGSMFSNDTSIPPEEHDPRKGVQLFN